MPIPINTPVQEARAIRARLTLSALPLERAPPAFLLRTAPRWNLPCPWLPFNEDKTHMRASSIILNRSKKRGWYSCTAPTKRLNITKDAITVNARKKSTLKTGLYTEDVQRGG